jgi:hypothetical protein
MAKLTAGQPLDLISLSQAENKIGDVKQSMLTLEEFQSEHLGVWKLMDGGSCAGSAYATLKGVTVVPDARGQFLRMKNHGRTDTHKNTQGELNLGQQQSHDWKDFYMSNNSNGVAYTHGWHGGQKRTSVHTTNQTFGGGWASGGTINWYYDASEVRPANITVNYFIKVGY